MPKQIEPTTGKKRKPWGTLYRTKTWGDPVLAQRAAVKAGKRIKLFTCSLSDFFHEGADQWRAEAWDVIRKCPDVDFLVLTKRAERMERHLPADWGEGYKNVWLGVSVGVNKTIWRADYLRKVPAIVHFISAEPLLESIASDLDLTNIQWLIAGGESGEVHRRMKREWADELRLKCEAANVTFFFKQSSGYLSGEQPDLLGKLYQIWPAAA
jgi:protein gp37